MSETRCYMCGELVDRDNAVFVGQTPAGKMLLRHPVCDDIVHVYYQISPRDGDMVVVEEKDVLGTINRLYETAPDDYERLTIRPLMLSKGAFLCLTERKLQWEYVRTNTHGYITIRRGQEERFVDIRHHDVEHELSFFKGYVAAMNDWDREESNE